MASSSRFIKSSFFTNKDLSECSAYTRLLFIGLWFEADRYGFLYHNTPRLRAKIFPFESFEDSQVDDLLSQLEELEFVRIGTFGGVYKECGELIYVVNFSAHQRPHDGERALYEKRKRG